MAKKLQILRLIFYLRTYQKRKKKKMKNNRAQKKAQWNFWRLKHNYAETPKRRFTCKMRCRGYCYFECIIIYIFFPYTANEYG